MVNTVQTDDDDDDVLPTRSTSPKTVQPSLARNLKKLDAVKGTPSRGGKRVAYKTTPPWDPKKLAAKREEFWDTSSVLGLGL